MAKLSVSDSPYPISILMCLNSSPNYNKNEDNGKPFHISLSKSAPVPSVVFHQGTIPKRVCGELSTTGKEDLIGSSNANASIFAKMQGTSLSFLCINKE